MVSIKVAFIIGVLGNQVETDRHGVLTCADVDMLHELSAYSRRQRPATLVFDGSRLAITLVSSAPTDLVVALSPRESAGEAVAVQLMKRPTLLYLRKSHARFDEFYGQLQRALAGKKQVAFGVMPGSDQIEDIRIDGLD